MRLIVIIDKYGGYCNRLFQSLHYHAFAMEEGAIFLNPSMLGILKFDNYFFYFFDKINNLFLKSFSRIIKFVLGKEEFCFYYRKNNYIKIVKGWEFRKNNLTTKFYVDLKNLYSFDKKNLSNKLILLIASLNSLKRQGKYIVGLHIRRKDYKSWNKGKYYFSDQIYKQIINKLKEKLIQDKHIPYILVLSDDVISPGLNFDYLSNGSWKEDQLILQTCDLIIGPPSTFTMWASYISQTPLIQIKDDGDIDFADVKICKG